MNHFKQTKNFNFLKNSLKRFGNSFEYKVSLIQRPGDSEKRRVTILPGEGIGRELFS
jgi:hypothetical protein